MIGDSARGFGGVCKGGLTGALCDITTTSFFPAKPLGCYGDGGAIFTDDAGLAALIDSCRVHGKRSHWQVGLWQQACSHSRRRQFLNAIECDLGMGDERGRPWRRT